jgi:hypothetical protein
MGPDDDSLSIPGLPVVSTRAPEDQSLAVLQRGDPVVSWLDSLPERKRSAVLQYAASERSPVLSFLYASMLGLDGSIDEWEAFTFRVFDRLDTRGILQSEITKLQGDIEELRTLRGEGKMRSGEAATKVSYLSRELRGHIEALSKEQTLHDRRSLLLAGVEVASKMLKKVFQGDASTWPAIEATLEACWADISERHQAK